MSDETKDLKELGKKKAKKKETKTLDVVNVKDAKEKVNDIEVFGNGDAWQLICKASSASQGWMKSTKAMELHNGCLVQVTTQQGDQVSEALQFVPNVIIGNDIKGNVALLSHLTRKQ